MNVHAISTGTLRIKNSHRSGRGQSLASRRAFWLLDPTFTEPLPIYVWVIEHPEGVIVVDTGDTVRSLEPDFYAPGARFVYKSAFKWQITPEDEAGPQLRGLGIPPEDVRWVVMTHTHIDHSNGFHHFPNAEILISQTEWQDAMSQGASYGAETSRWPAWLRPTLIDYAPEAIGPFSHSHPLTQDGTVRIVPTPGHTRGHQSLIVQDEDVTFFFAGDTSFGIPSLRQQRVDAMAFDATVHRRTQQTILDFVQETPTVYLPSHDPDSGRRLAERETLQITA